MLKTLSFRSIVISSDATTRHVGQQRDPGVVFKDIHLRGKDHTGSRLLGAAGHLLLVFYLEFFAVAHCVSLPCGRFGSTDGDLFRFGCRCLGDDHGQHSIGKFGFHLVRIDVAGQADDTGKLAGFAFPAVIPDAFAFGRDCAFSRYGQVSGHNLNVQGIGLDARQFRTNVVIVRILGEIDGRKTPWQAASSDPVCPADLASTDPFDGTCAPIR